MEPCKLLLAYGIVFSIFILNLVLRNRKRNLHILIYLINLIVFLKLYSSSCHTNHIVNRGSKLITLVPSEASSKFSSNILTLTTIDPDKTSLNVPYYNDVRQSISRSRKSSFIRRAPLTKHQLASEMKHLPPREVKEISSGDWEYIYFTGQKGIEKIRYNDSVDALNGGLDISDSENEELAGTYKIVEGDHLDYRYEILKNINAGVYGSVVKALDHKYNLTVAVKVMHNHTSLASRMQLETFAIDFIANRTNEIDKPFVVGAIRKFNFRNHLCLVYELLGTSLHDHKEFKRKSIAGDKLKSIAWDVLEGLAVLNRIQLVHGDMKPDNILFTGKEYPSVKIIDYSLSCYRNAWQLGFSRAVKCPKYYIMTRYYRAPEVILAHNYTTQADMWSFGCIIGELYRGYELIYGETETDQFSAIMEIIGLPPVSMVENSSRRHKYFEAVNHKTEDGFQRVPYRKSLAKVLKTNDTYFEDFMSKIMVWEPEKRLTPIQAMKHPWLSEFAEQRFKRIYSNI